MIIVPKVRGFICTTAHPEGCAANVKQQINYAKTRTFTTDKELRVLVIGASTGYGLASRIVASFSAKAKTIGVFFERSALITDMTEKTASAGWYNSAAFEQEAALAGLYAKSINGDAFSVDLKKQTIDLIAQDWGGVDLVVYSLASPRRVDASGTVYNSVLKPVGESYKNKTVDFNTGKVSDVEIAPASMEEIDATIKVMGGEDLEDWINCLHHAKLLAKNCKVVAYSYIGPAMTYQIYRNGTIGHAKEHLEAAVKKINEFLINNYNGRALVSVNKALVTQASAAIPVVPLYISLLYKVMKNKNIHEGCIEQISRLFTENLYNNDQYLLDQDGRIRVDDLEMREDVQQEVLKLWSIINTENLAEIADLTGYREEFYKLFGFNMLGVDYSKDYNVNVEIPSIIEYA